MVRGAEGVCVCGEEREREGGREGVCVESGDEGGTRGCRGGGGEGVCVCVWGGG